MEDLRESLLIMDIKEKNLLDKDLRKIWHQVPPDYYQNGVKSNLLQGVWHSGKLKAVFDLIDNSTDHPKKILDIGCASGWFLSMISNRYPNAKCIGLDIYKKAIEYGQERYENLEFLYADAHKLPFKNESFDLVICTEVLEHVENPEKVLTEIKRVLTPKGIAMVEMDTGNILFRLVWHWWTNIRHGVWKDSHIHKFNTKILESIISEAGFFVLSRKVFNYTMGIVFCLKKTIKNEYYK